MYRIELVISRIPFAVVYVTNPDRSKVALICGGGSGHEPAHAVFVGEFDGCGPLGRI